MKIGTGTALIALGSLGVLFMLGRKEQDPQLAAAEAQQRYYEEQLRKRAAGK